MPVMDGLTATQRLRELGIRIPIVGLSANATAKDIQVGREAGMTEFFAKPLAPVEMLKITRHFAALTEQLGEGARGESGDGSVI